MDYFIKGRIFLETSEDLEVLLAVENEIKSTTLKNGYVSRHHYGGNRSDMFTFQARSYNHADAVKLFNLFKNALEGNDITGWIGWHDCDHENIPGPCTWDQHFSFPGGAF